MHMTDNSIDLV